MNGVQPGHAFCNNLVDIIYSQGIGPTSGRARDCDILESGSSAGNFSPDKQRGGGMSTKEQTINVCRYFGVTGKKFEDLNKTMRGGRLSWGIGASTTARVIGKVSNPEHAVVVDSHIMSSIVLISCQLLS